MSSDHTSGSRPVALANDPGSTTRKMLAISDKGSPELIRGKGPNGVFISAIYVEDGKFFFDADALSLGAQKPEFYASGWKGSLGTGKKFIKDQFTADELEAIYIAHQREVAEKQLAVSLEGVPFYASRSHSVSDVGAAAMGRAIEKAGFKFGDFMSEQSAVVYGYMNRNNLASRPNDLTYFVFDQGGWSQDCCVGVAGGGRIDIKGTRSIPNVGGIEMSRRLKEFVLGKGAKLFGVKTIDESKYDADTLFQFQERVDLGKINLTSHESVQFNVINQETGKVKSVAVTQREYHANVLDPLLKPMRECLDQTLADAKMTVKDVEFLIGSGAPMASKYMCNWLGEIFGRPMEPDVDSALAVIRGVAAYAFDDLTKQGKTKVITMPEPVEIFDLLPAMIAIMTHIDGSLDLFATPLFEKNTKVPSETVQRFRLMHKDQDCVDIKIAQAPQAYAKLSDVKIIGNGRINNLPREQIMTDRLECRCKTKRGGLADVTVVDTISQQSTFITAQILN